MHERGSAGADGARLGEDVEINCQGTEREGGRREERQIGVRRRRRRREKKGARMPGRDERETAWQSDVA